MQVLVAVARGVLAIAVSLIFIDESKSGPVQLESEAGVVTMTATGTVEAVDVTNRLLTIVGPQGYPQVFVVGPTVQHIEKIKMRETVTIAYTQEVAMALRKFDGPPINKDEAMTREEEAGMDMNAPAAAEQDWIEATPKGASDLTTIEITDTVAAINHNKRLITFAGTGGKTRTIWVDPSVQGFNQIQVGDRIVLLVTRAVAVNVTIT
jgi:hypothetical protein